MMIYPALYAYRIFILHSAFIRWLGRLEPGEAPVADIPDLASGVFGAEKKHPWTKAMQDQGNIVLVPVLVEEIKAVAWNGPSLLNFSLFFHLSTMGVILLIRQVVLGLTALLSLVALAIAAHLISQTQLYFGLTATFCALGVAAAVISLVTLPVMLVVDFLRRSAFTSMIVVELVWLFILCVLWVATAGEAVSEVNVVFPYGCDFTNTIYNGMCQQAQAIEAFAFLNFIILLLYIIFLFIMAIIAVNRGAGVWLSSVKESFGPSTGPAEQHSMSQHNALESERVHSAGATV